MTKGEESQWYTNKDLFEMLQSNNKELTDSIKQVNKELTDSIKQVNVKIDGLSDELVITRHEMKEYNNLRGTLNTNIKDVIEVKKEVEDVKKEISDDKAKKKGIESVGSAVIRWGGWGIALATFVAKIFGWI
jgi:predicted RNase H-like nuclease (RuvC/YqgF family)